MGKTVWPVLLSEPPFASVGANLVPMRRLSRLELDYAGLLRLRLGPREEPAYELRDCPPAANPVLSGVCRAPPG